MGTHTIKYKQDKKWIQKGVNSPTHERAIKYVTDLMDKDLGITEVKVIYFGKEIFSAKKGK